MFTLGNVSVDGPGRLAAASETITNTSQSQIQHSYLNYYDMRSQLLSATMSNVGGLNYVTNAYVYDRAGNVQHHVYTPVPGSASTTTYGFIHDSLNSDLMELASSSDYGGENFDPAWDKNGNMTAKVQQFTNMIH